jgi:NAD(P)H-dependent flavin oxidoreductase YrpB (nitropropane dioxygenase family)
MDSDYDVINLIPKERGAIPHRGDVDLRSCLYNRYPIISSPMKGISGTRLVIEMGKNNCLGILHRFDEISVRYSKMLEISRSGVPFGVAVRFGETEEEIQQLITRMFFHCFPPC